MRVEQRVIDRLGIAFDLQAEARWRGSKGQARDPGPTVRYLRVELERHATASLFSFVGRGIERQVDVELAGGRPFPAELNAVAPAVSEGWVEFERDRAWARGSSRANPDHTRDCQPSADERSQALRGPR